MCRVCRFRGHNSPNREDLGAWRSRHIDWVKVYSFTCVSTNKQTKGVWIVVIKLQQSWVPGTDSGNQGISVGSHHTENPRGPWGLCNPMIHLTSRWLHPHLVSWKFFFLKKKVISFLNQSLPGRGWMAGGNWKKIQEKASVGEFMTQLRL